MTLSSGAPDISVIIPTLVRESLYPLVEELLQQDCALTLEIVLIAQPIGRIDRTRLESDDRIVVHEEPLGKGFGYYRHVGVELARGKILVWIDDDEQPMSRTWLSELTRPIANGDERVVTAGCHIPLGQGYIADCISWLGLPGGGYPGFEAMWHVDSLGFTEHLCTGNFAIDRDTLVAVGGFEPSMTSGNEDTELSDRLLAAGIRIHYLPSATVFHDARKSLKAFTAWHVERGAANRLLIARNLSTSRSKIAARLLGSGVLLRRVLFTRYFPGVVLTTCLQYGAQLIGYIGLVQTSRPGSDEGRFKK